MKKFFSSLTAAGVSILSLMPITSLAIPSEFSNLDDSVSAWTEGLSPLDEKYRPLYDIVENDRAIYISDDACHVRYIYPIDYEEETITLADGVTVERANAFLKELFEPLDAMPYLSQNGTLPDGTPCYEGLLGTSDFHKIACKHLKENGMIGSYVVKTGFYTYYDCYYDQVLNYEHYNEETFSKIASYIEKKNIGELCLQDYPAYGDSVEKIVINDNVTIAEQMDVALEIYEKFNVVPYGVSPTGLDENTSGCIIDCFNAVDGDANEDGVVDIADATLILQAIGNPDKYGLTPQGEYNADVNCSGGVTALDALEVQKIDANRE